MTIIFLEIIFLKNFFFNFIFLFYKYLFNNTVVEHELNLFKFLKNNFGIGFRIIKKIEQRLENNLMCTVLNLNNYELDQFLILLYSVIPSKSSVFKRICVKICYLDLITSYRGWRHSKGLPVRGQRTWSNSWSVYRSNNILRNLKIGFSKSFYTSIPPKESNVAYLAEYVNFFWKKQWSKEWHAAYKSRIRFKGHIKSMRIDLYSMSNYQIMHPLKLKSLSKKQKQSFNKNYFSLGFDLGFTKPLLNSLFNKSESSSNNSSMVGSKLILRKEQKKR